MFVERGLHRVEVHDELDLGIIVLKPQNIQLKWLVKISKVAVLQQLCECRSHLLVCLVQMKVVEVGALLFQQIVLGQNETIDNLVHGWELALVPSDVDFAVLVSHVFAACVA